MANIKVGLSKKSTVILLLLFFVLIGGGGGFLLWRVNQAKTVAPTDSDASETVDDSTCLPLPAGECIRESALPPYPTREQYARICTIMPSGEHGYCKYSKSTRVVAYHITFNAGTGGTVSPSGQQRVEPNKSITSTAKPDDDDVYEFAGWEGSGGGDVSDMSEKQLTISNVNSDATYTAKFKEKKKAFCKFTYKVHPDGGGSIKDGPLEQTVYNGATGTKVTATPASTHNFVKWNEDGKTTAARTDKCSNTNVSTPVNKTFTAVFQEKDVPVVKYDLTYKTDGNGTIDEDKQGPHKVEKGKNGPSVVAKAKTGYKFASWSEKAVQSPVPPKPWSSPIIGTPSGPHVTSSRVDRNVQASMIITANFKKACGDKVCDSWENMTNCPADCKGCGDGKCVAPENAQTCAKDCKAKCGDKLCTHDENAKTCPGDCKAVCGDKFCTHNENAETCPDDCKAKCGDNICSPSENAQTCPQDCPVNCGDGICSEDENPEKCPADCPSVCGDGMCTGGESSADCPDDCGSPVVGEVVPETGIFDDSRHTMIFGAVVLVVGIAWTWIATLPKKVIHTVSSVSSTISSANDKLKREKLTRERNSRRSKLEERIK